MLYVCDGSNGCNIIVLTSEVVWKYYAYRNQKQIYLMRKKCRNTALVPSVNRITLQIK